MNASEFPTPISREELAEKSPQPGDRIFHYGIEFEVKSLSGEDVIFHGRVISPLNSEMLDDNHQFDFKVSSNDLVAKRFVDGTYGWGIEGEKSLGEGPVTLLSHSPDIISSEADLHFLLYFSRSLIKTSLTYDKTKIPSNSSNDSLDPHNKANVGDFLRIKGSGSSNIIRADEQYVYFLGKKALQSSLKLDVENSTMAKWFVDPEDVIPLEAIDLYINSSRTGGHNPIWTEIPLWELQSGYCNITK